MEQVRILDGVGNMDFLEVTDMLARAAWCPGIGIDEVRKGTAHSALVVGAFCGDRQVGYARAVSDCVRFAYVSDVFVHEDFRHLGIAKRMMRHMMAHESLQDVYQWALRSAANELYQQLGFAPLSEPEKWMEIRKPRPAR